MSSWIFLAANQSSNVSGILLPRFNIYTLTVHISSWKSVNSSILRNKVGLYLVDPIVWLHQTTLLFAGLWQCVWLARIWCGWRTSRPIKASLQEAWIPPFLYLFKRMTSTSTVYKIHMTSTITVWFKSDLPVTPIFWWLSLSSTKYMYRISSLFAWHKICENAFLFCISRFWWF